MLKNAIPIDRSQSKADAYTYYLMLMGLQFSLIHDIDILRQRESSFYITIDHE